MDKGETQRPPLSPGSRLGLLQVAQGGQKIGTQVSVVLPLKTRCWGQGGCPKPQKPKGFGGSGVSGQPSLRRGRWGVGADPAEAALAQRFPRRSE